MKFCHGRAAAKMINREVAFPPWDRYSVANDFTVFGRPTRTKGLKVRVACFDIYGYFFCFQDRVRERMLRWKPV